MTHLREAATDTEWQQATALLQRVYVGGGYTPAENASPFMTRSRLEHEGVLIIAIDEQEDVVGAVLLLHEASTLRQLARANEREFRILAVDERARGAGVGEALVQDCLDRAFGVGASAVVIWTQPTMHSAQRLYVRLGFQRAPERDEQDLRGFTRMVFRRSR